MKTLMGIALAGLLLGPVLTSAEPVPFQSPDIPEMFKEISTLRSEGRYDQAITELREIISHYTASDEILRRAFNELVFSILQKREAQPADAADMKQALYDEAVAQAEVALRKYPDLAADPSYMKPDEANLIYESVRARIFGGLSVTSVPDSCNVFVDSLYLGATPLDIEHYPVGDYELTLTKSGYVDGSTSITIYPSRGTDVPMQLRKERGRKWWLTRVVTPVAAGLGAIVALVIANDNPPAEDEPAEPLPGPPDPPE